MSSLYNVKEKVILFCKHLSSGDTLQQAIHVLPLLLQTLDKAEKQPGQPQLMSEAVSAACLLVKISMVDILAGRGFTFPRYTFIFYYKDKTFFNIYNRK